MTRAQLAFGRRGGVRGWAVEERAEGSAWQSLSGTWGLGAAAPCAAPLLQVVNAWGQEQACLPYCGARVIRLFEEYMQTVLHVVSLVG